jgi:predicted house-cleaning noncanonical NTP pyrophosphatase (MazG superfamily)
VGKLVRDKVPDIIRASGRPPHVTMLAAGAYRTALYDKLREEVDEHIAARTTDAVIEEGADVVEVITAIAADRGVTLDGILDAAQRKRAERGGFGMQLWLDSVDH